MERLSTSSLEVKSLDRTGLSAARTLRRLLAGSRGFDAVVVDGSTGLRGGYIDLVAASILSHRRDGPVVVVADATWKRRTIVDRMLGGLAVRFLDGPRVVFVVHSTEETRLFPKTWGVNPSRVRFVAWSHILRPDELAAPPGARSGVFAGGDSLRDYDPLIAAAGGLRDPVTIATRLRSVGRRRRLPPNLTIGPVPDGRFTDLMRRASVVVVPVRAGIERSAGQTVFLNAMALGTPVIATDSFVARDYISDHQTGVIVPPGDATALRAAVDWILNPANKARVEAMAERAREVVTSTFTPRGYLEGLIGVIGEALVGGSAPPSGLRTDEHE